MIFRFTLSHEILGSLEITPPDGWADAVLKLERDKNFHSLVEYFDGSFIFYGNDGEINGGIDFIRQVEQDYGFDADLGILIEVSFDDYTYETVFTGLLKLEAIQEMADNKIQVPIVRNDFWSKFINRLDTPVDVLSEQSLDREEVNQFDNITVNLTSQKLQQIFSGAVGKGVIIGVDWNTTTDFNGDNVQLSMDDVELDEIRQRFSIPIALNPEIPVNIFTFEFGGDYHIVSTIFYGLIDTAIGAVSPHDLSAHGDPNDLLFYYQINDDTPVAFPTLSVVTISNGGPSSDTGPSVNSGDLNKASLDVTLTLEAGDEFRIFAQTTGEFAAASAINFIIYGVDNFEVDAVDIFLVGPGATINFGTIDPEDSGPNYTFLEITAQTIFPATDSSGFFLHDVGGQIADRIISRDDTFYSEYLGSQDTVYRDYDQDGCGWGYTLLKGLQIRQYTLTEKPFFQSFKTWWDGANPILNLGLGYEEINDQEVIRVEEKEHFYNPEISFYIDNVRDIRRVYDPERIFKTVKIGYKQWQSENISGIDDPQTKHTYASRLQKSGTDLTLESEFIAASLAIETTRRTTREKSADYKFDNETFIIAINESPFPLSPATYYQPELDEDFDSVTNLLNAETRYNLRITPARNLIRWLRYISGGLQSYLSSVFKFTAGEGNYDMVSDMSNTSDGCDEYKGELSEKQDIPVYDDPMHLALLYEITIPLEWEDYKTIRDNRKNAIGISQTDENHIAFFIKDLDYEIAKSQATITAWPVELLSIEVIETIPALIQCTPVTTFPLTADNTLITADSTVITADQTEYTI